MTRSKTSKDMVQRGQIRSDGEHRVLIGYQNENGRWNYWSWTPDVWRSRKARSEAQLTKAYPVVESEWNCIPTKPMDADWRREYEELREADRELVDARNALAKALVAMPRTCDNTGRVGTDCIDRECEPVCPGCAANAALIGAGVTP